jgi:hypothetical protein
VRRPLLYLARFLEDGAERGAYSSSSQQQQLEQDQQPEQQQQQQVAGRPETSGSCYVRSPLPFLTQIVGEQVHLARSEVTGGADAASVEAVMAAAAAAGAAAADAAGDTIGPTSSRGPRPARPLPCPWLGNLQCLVLRSCGLKRLPAPALASLTAVTSLNLSNNRLRLLPPGLRFLKQLQVGEGWGTVGVWCVAGWRQGRWIAVHRGGAKRVGRCSWCAALEAGAHTRWRQAHTQ